MNWEEKLNHLPPPLTQIINKTNNAVCFTINSRIATYKREVEAFPPFCLSTQLRWAPKTYNRKKILIWQGGRLNDQQGILSLLLLVQTCPVVLRKFPIMLAKHFF